MWMSHYLYGYLSLYLYIAKPLDQRQEVAVLVPVLCCFQYSFPLTVDVLLFGFFEQSVILLIRNE